MNNVNTNDRILKLCVQNEQELIDKECFFIDRKTILEYNCAICGKHIVKKYRKGRPNRMLCRIHSTEQTCVEKYGVKSHLLLNEMQNKAHETIHRHAVEKQNERTKQLELKRRIKQEEKHKRIIDEFGSLENFNYYKSLSTNDKVKFREILKYGSHDEAQKHRCNKARETYQKVYGTDWITQTKQYKDKVKNTCELKYGVEHSFQSELVKDKIKKTLISRIGVDNPQRSKEIQMRTRLTNEKRYGGSAPACSHEVLRKMQETCEERYGVSNFSLSPLFSSYHRKRIFHDGIYFDSTWEVSVYEFCKMNNIKFEYSPSIIYEYEYDGKIYTYHPDFLIDGKVYEVKGDNFFRINESTGMEEMYCPWRYPEWSDEHYNWMCGKYQAKHQCMLKNNVIILREEDMKNLEMRVKHTCVDA